MDSLRGLLGIRIIDKVSIREMGGVTKRVAEGIDESALRRVGHIERMRNDRIAKKVCVGECVGSRLVGRQRKRWIERVEKEKGVERSTLKG